MIKILEKIKIGGRIIEVRRGPSSEMGSQWGTYSDWQGIIRIANDSDLHPAQEAVSFIHEIIEHLDSKFQYKLEHSIIQSLAENFYQIIVDNFMEANNAT